MESNRPGGRRPGDVRVATRPAPPLAAAKRRPEESKARHLDRPRCCCSGDPNRGRRRKWRAST
eukprot:7535081-Lingulodinium_polyedra.AAC.1